MEDRCRNKNKMYFSTSYDLWPSCQMASAKKSRVQTLACFGKMGVLRTTATGAMVALTGLPPLDLVIKL